MARDAGCEEGTAFVTPGVYNHVERRRKAGLAPVAARIDGVGRF